MVKRYIVYKFFKPFKPVQVDLESSLDHQTSL